uniref:Uncharacterized protein n=1 Tax=Glossina brevipalpis TaxID=37001 RepID=A0A1A9VZ09_9MUSC
MLVGVHEVRPFWLGVVECHAIYAPDFRGRYALEGHRLFCRWLLENSTFTNSITLVPDTTKYGRVIIRLLGARRVGHLDDAYLSAGKPVGVTLYQLTRAQYEELANFKNKLAPMHGLMKGGDGGAGAQADAMKQATALQREQWETVMKNLEPYMQAGRPALEQLQGLSTLEGQNKALGDYYNSDQYRQLADQARYQSLASAEATGGLGSTATGNQLAAIAPALGQNWLSGQMQNYGNNTSQLLQQQAALAAARANRPSGFQGFTSGALGGAATGAAIGSVVPGLGTGIGAIGGGLIGALGSLF